MTKLPAKPTKYDAWAYVIIGLLGVIMLAFSVAALVLPPGICFGLIRRGLSEGRWHWTLLGVLIGLLWLFFLTLAARRVFGRQRKLAAEAVRDETRTP